MRLSVIITLLVVIVVGVAAQDHLATLGISEGRAKEAVFDSFMADAASMVVKPAAFTAMAPAARVALVNFALTPSRCTFAESDDFKRRYADHREANGPEPLPGGTKRRRDLREAAGRFRKPGRGNAQALRSDFYALSSVPRSRRGGGRHAPATR